jgi:hypothetical protein
MTDFYVESTDIVGCPQVKEEMSKVLGLSWWQKEAKPEAKGYNQKTGARCEVQGARPGHK